MKTTLALLVGVVIAKIYFPETTDNIFQALFIFVSDVLRDTDAIRRFTDFVSETSTVTVALAGCISGFCLLSQYRQGILALSPMTAPITLITSFVIVHFLYKVAKTDVPVGIALAKAAIIG